MRRPLLSLESLSDGTPVLPVAYVQRAVPVPDPRRCHTACLLKGHGESKTPGVLETQE